jgi:hypothetical protein
VVLVVVVEQAGMVLTPLHITYLPKDQVVVVMVLFGLCIGNNSWLYKDTTLLLELS